MGITDIPCNIDFFSYDVASGSEIIPCIKIDKMLSKPSILSLFPNLFNKFNNT